MKQALWVSHWSPFPSPYAAQTVPFPIFLHVGAKFFSSHIPGKNLKVRIEKYSKGFQTSVASSVHRASEEAWGSTVMFPPSDQVRGRRGGLRGDELQFPYLANAWKLKKINPGQWELSEFSFCRLSSSNQLPVILLFCPLSPVLSRCSWICVLCSQFQAVFLMWLGLCKASDSKNLFGTGNTLTHKALFLHALFFWLQPHFTNIFRSKLTHDA